MIWYSPCRICVYSKLLYPIKNNVNLYSISAKYSYDAMMEKLIMINLNEQIELELQFYVYSTVQYVYICYSIGG